MMLDVVNPYGQMPTYADHNANHRIFSEKKSNNGRNAMTANVPFAAWLL